MHLMVSYGRQRKVLHYEEAVTEFWHPGTILKHLKVFANQNAYQTIRSLSQTSKFLFNGDNSPLNVQTLCIRSNRWNKFNILHPNRAFFEELIQAEKVKKTFKKI